MRTYLWVVCFAGLMVRGLMGTGALKADQNGDTIWKQERTKDGRIVLSDGKLTVHFPADAKVETKGGHASVHLEQAGYLTVERKEAPADAKMATDPREWLKKYVEDEVETG